MLHDVTVEIFDPHTGARRELVRVDAEGGDDAVRKASVEAATISVGRPWKIVGVTSAPVEEPTAPPPAPKAGHKAKAKPGPNPKTEQVPAHMAAIEGADVPDDTDA